MPEYLYHIQPTRPAMLTQGPTPEEGELIQAHFDYIKGLVDKGIAHFVGRTLNLDAEAMGLMAFSAADEASAEAIMNADPAVGGGVMKARLFPFKTLMTGPRA